MDKEKLYRLAEQLRSELHEMVDTQIDEVIHNIENPGYVSTGERSCSLYMPSSFFKGKKPAAIVFPDGERIPVHTWRETAEIILKDCNADEIMHEKLLDVSGKVMGRNRMILGKTAAGMNKPLKIDDGIYFESYFDTEYLLNMMKERVLDVVGYDYSHIELSIYDPKMQKETACVPLSDNSNGEDETERDVFTMTM